MQRLSTPLQPAAAAPEKSLEDIHKEVMTRIQPILSGVWPAEAPLRDFDLVFGPTGITFNVRYESIHELDKISQGMIVRELQEKLGTADISLVAQRVSPRRKENSQARQKPR